MRLSASCRLARLAEASSILVTSVTGYRRRFPVADADALWLATGCEGPPDPRQLCLAPSGRPAPPRYW